MNCFRRNRGWHWVFYKRFRPSTFRYVLPLLTVIIVICLLKSDDLVVGNAINAFTFGYLTSKAKTALREELRLVVINLMELQHGLDISKHHFHKIGAQVEFTNSILRSIQEDDFGLKISGKPSRRRPRKQDVCPETFLGKGLGFGRADCKEFLAMHQLITLLIFAPKEFTRQATSYLEMMEGVEKFYSKTRIILATSKRLPKATDSAITKLNIKFKNEVIGNINHGAMWVKLLEQVDTPYVLIAPYITHFDDDIDLYRLVRVLSYNDDVSVAGGSYRNLTAHWDLGCRQVSFHFWTAKFSTGYYRSFNECVVCDYLPGPFAAKTKLLTEVTLDSSLSSDTFHDFFWRLKYKKVADNVAVVCPDVMFNIDTPSIDDHQYTAFADKQEIKKMIEPEGRVRWYGCRHGFSHTIGKKCSWLDGMAVPPCDLENLWEIIKFIMTTCQEENIICEYVAGTNLGAVKFGSVLPWEKDGDIDFYADNFTALVKLKSKFEAAGFRFDIDRRTYRCCEQGRASGGVFEVRTTNWHVSLVGRHTIEAGDMLENGQSPTKVPVAGTWFTAPRNPGLFSRNRYAHEYFRHAEHHGGYRFYDAGSFKTCPKLGHSACLDQYLPDGSLQLSDYVPKRS